VLVAGLLSMRRLKVCVRVRSKIGVLTRIYVLVDENLFYKGVDKTKVHGARLHQIHSPGGPAEHASLIAGTCDLSQTDHPVCTTSTDDPAKAEETPCKEQEGRGQSHNPLEPPYPFDTGASLLALTHKHNVCLLPLFTRHGLTYFCGYSYQ
jgi:hypothetical protein